MGYKCPVEKLSRYVINKTVKKLSYDNSFVLQNFI